MQKTRNNHYVPQWYQKGFFEQGKNTLVYLDLKPKEVLSAEGKKFSGKSLFKTAPTSRCFFQTDLYSTFFGTSINDEIERLLFGDIDSRGAKAIRAFCTDDKARWHSNFQTLFEFIDIQKLRTPKGLDWLRSQYPRISQNDLMQEMQGIRMMHCSIWSEGIKEIVSAEDSEVKFIVSDHPVTIYNHAIVPHANIKEYPHDPSITRKGSQTIFPLNRNFCLILTNLEYGKDPTENPTEKRTFPRHFKYGMARTDAFIRTRKLVAEDVMKLNYIIKNGARRYLAAGKLDWLYPEKLISEKWKNLRTVLLPPVNELYKFGGELFAKFDSGDVHYQDEFGRTEGEREFLKKTLPLEPLRSKDYCGCGSGKNFKDCCQNKSINKRPTWEELSIRERNLSLLNGVADILGLDDTKDWIGVRRDLTNEQISKIYHLYEALWPKETDILSLLPKTDGVSRAVYTGILHPELITEFALGASLYFGEIIIQHPFLHPGTVKQEFNPVKNPQNHRLEFLKSILQFIIIMPLVEAGIVTLVPDPCNFDRHLQQQMLAMAEARKPFFNIEPEEDPRYMRMMKGFHKQTHLLMPESALIAQIFEPKEEMNDEKIAIAKGVIQRMKEDDPLVDLGGNPLSKDDGGQMNFLQLAPNFEMAMYLAQATGACIITDSPFRWREIQFAIQATFPENSAPLVKLRTAIEDASFIFPQIPNLMPSLKAQPKFKAYDGIISSAFKYLSNIEKSGIKNNLECGLKARFNRTHTSAQKELTNMNTTKKTGKILCAFPYGGIRHHTVNRLLLMSNSDQHLQNVPMAFLMQPRKIL
ncbi:DUF4238 domain-containing protein [Hellea balneolensis]|uniref:DUF4238 domain-containing protein n=1 Tax=Hellea balneolensis TaxID=287478 RepID=UPI00041E5125|nr:DUF4238 domain-containing protein [Hellea balneolensis]